MRGRGATAGLALAVAAGLPATARAEADGVSPARFIVAVGQNEAPDRAPLRFADDDAARMFEILRPGAEIAALHVAFDAESQAVFGGLVGDAMPPTRAALEATLARIADAVAAARRAGRRTEVFFYYAGHGDAEDGRGRAFLADGELDRRFLERTLLDAPARADRIDLAVDACKSYFLVAGRGPGGERRAALTHFAGPARRPGVGFLLSTSSDADAHEWGAVGGGVFSHLLRSALLGAADVDNDGRVTYDEVGAFMAAATEGVTPGPFRPDVFVRPPPEDLRAPLTRLATVAFTPLRVESTTAGRISVIDERGLRFAETNKATGAPLTLALLTGRRYEVRLPARRATVEARGEPVELARAPDAGGDLLAARGEAQRALEGLFQTSFGPEVALGYRLGAAAGEGERERLAVEAPVSSAGPAEPQWLTPTLLGLGAAGLAGAGVLAVMATDAHADAAEANQTRREALTDRGNALTLGAAGAATLGLSALAWATWRLLDAP